MSEQQGQQTHGGGRLAAFTHNKPLMIGAAAVAGLGLFTFMKKSSSGAGTGGGTSAAPAAAGGGSAPGGGGDIGGQLGQFGTAVQRSLDEYGKTLNTTVAALQKAPTQAPPATQAPPTPTPTPTPAGPAYARVSAGQTFNDWYQGLKGRGLQPTYDQLNAWNPTQWGVVGAPVGIMGNTNSHPDHSLDFFNADALFRVT